MCLLQAWHALPLPTHILITILFHSFIFSHIHTIFLSTLPSFTSLHPAALLLSKFLCNWAAYMVDVCIRSRAYDATIPLMSSHDDFTSPPSSKTTIGLAQSGGV